MSTFDLPAFGSGSHVDLKELREELNKELDKPNGQGSVVLAAVSGMGGVGKTETAKSLIYSVEGKYELRAWFHGDSPLELLTSYRKWLVGSQVVSSLEEANKLSDERIVGMTNEQLSRLESFLIVIDNADKPDQVKKLLPRVVNRGQGRKHLVITSRSKEWKEVASVVVVNVPNEEEALRMLESHSGRKNVVGGEESKTLVREVGRLPLAVSQLGAYLRENEHVSVVELLKQWRVNMKRVMDRNDLGMEAKTVWSSLVTVLQSIDRKPLSELAETVLLMCSVLEPDRIPLSLLNRVLRKLIENRGQQLKADEIEDQVNGALRLLVSHNLLSFDGSSRSYSIHRLVQRAVELHHGGGKIESVLPVLVDSLNADFRSEDGGPLAAEARRVGSVPHLDCLLTLPCQSRANSSGNEESKQDSESRSRPRLTAIQRAAVLDMKAIVLEYNLRKPAEAKPLFEEALPIIESKFGPDSVEVARILTNLANVHGDLGHYSEKKTLLERAVGIFETAHGPNHPQVAITLTNLGDVYSSLGDYSKAKTVLERAIGIKETAYGPNHPHVATTLTNLAATLNQLKQPQEAKALAERALKIQVAVYGRDHPDVCFTESILAASLEQLNDIKGAIALHEHVLQVRTAFYGPNHKLTQQTQSHLNRLENSSSCSIL